MSAGEERDDQEPAIEGRDDELVFSASAEQKYFLAIEAELIRQRGAPLLLAPKEWRVAQRWYEQGIPLSLVLEAMADVERRRRERSATSKVNSLSYFRQAVEASWAEVCELSGIAARKQSASAAASTGAEEPRPAAELPSDLESQLRRLAQRLPETIDDVATWRQRIEDLAKASVPAEIVERQLAELDAELMDSLERALPETARAELRASVERTLAELAGRLDTAQLEVIERRLFLQRLRKRAGFPVLSLFGF